MAKATITVPSRVYQPGTRSVELPNLTSDDAGIKITMTRESWPDTGDDVLSGLMEGSNDNGANWFGLCGFSYAGGNMTNPRTGQPVLVCGPTCYWPESYLPDGTAVPHRPARVRCTLTNTVALRTAITLDGA